MLYRVSIFALLLLVFGCGGPSTTASVEGTVLYDNKPLAEATVQFVSLQGRISHGMTDAEGRFTLRTPEGPGVFSGDCAVLVTATKQGKPNPEIRYPTVVSLIPEKFGQQGFSGMNYDVKEDSTNRVKIVLTSNGQGTVSAAE